MARTGARKGAARPAAGQRVRKPTATGSCLCGAVRYEVRGPLRQVVNCHCGQCRKFHGHYGAYSSAAAKDISAPLGARVSKATEALKSFTL